MGPADLFYVSSFAAIEVADLERSVRWYADVAGFQAIASYRFEDGEAVHLRRSEGQDVLLRAATDAPSPGGSVVLCFASSSGLADLAEHASHAGAQPLYSPAAGLETESLTFNDPDGHELRFYARQVPGGAARP